MSAAEALRNAEREQCLLLLQKGGQAWHEYVIDKAAKLENAEPVLHRGLRSQVRAFIENARMKRMSRA